jgi:hypothetical protein
MVQQQPQGSAWYKASVAAWLLFDLLPEGSSKAMLMQVVHCLLGPGIHAVAAEGS